MGRVASVLVALSLFSLAPSFDGNAQDSANAKDGYVMRGVVTTSEGSAVRNAQISVVGVDAITTTNDSGRFSIDRLPGGTRVVEFRALGFSPQYLPVGIGAKTPFLFVRMDRLTMLDSVRIVAVGAQQF